MKLFIAFVGTLHFLSDDHGDKHLVKSGIFTIDSHFEGIDGLPFWEGDLEYISSVVLHRHDEFASVAITNMIVVAK